MLLALGAGPPEEASAQPPGAGEARRILDRKAGPHDLTRAIALLKAAKGQSESLEVLTLLAEAYYLRGDDLEDREQAVGDLEAAMAHADRALRLRPGHVPARYWRAVAMLSKAGKLRSVGSFGLVREAARELEAVAAADPDLDGAGADRAMGKVFLDSPWWFLGDVEKAVTHLERARRRAPEWRLNRRFLAEAYLEDGREADALRELEELLRLPLRPGREAADREQQERARHLADRIRARRRTP